MAVAVILILSGASGFGFTFGLVVAGMAGILLVSTLLYDVAHSEPRDPPRSGRPHRGSSAKGF